MINDYCIKFTNLQPWTIIILFINDIFWNRQLDLNFWLIAFGICAVRCRCAKIRSDTAYCWFISVKICANFKNG
jgi:hypothetical protein